MPPNETQKMCADVDRNTGGEALQEFSTKVCLAHTNKYIATQLFEEYGLGPRTCIVISRTTQKKTAELDSVSEVIRMRDVIQPMLQLAGGRIIKRSRNKYFVAFESSLNACYAVTMSRAAILKYNEQLTGGDDESRKRNVNASGIGQVITSFGIAQGAVLIVPGCGKKESMDGDLYGDAVNVASKLGEDIAQEDDVQLSPQVYTDVLASLNTATTNNTTTTTNNTNNSSNHSNDITPITNPGLVSISCAKRSDTVSHVLFDHFCLLDVELEPNSRATAHAHAISMFQSHTHRAEELRNQAKHAVLQTTNTDNADSVDSLLSHFTLSDCVLLHEFLGVLDAEWSVAVQKHIEAIAKQKYSIEKSVLSTDMSGFTRLVKKFGIIHFLRMIIGQRSVVNYVVEKPEFGGRVIGYEGDDIFAVFDAPQLAIQASMECFRKLEEYNADQPEESKILVKIGVHHGTFLVYENELFGHDAEMGEWLSEGVGERMCVQVSEAVEKMVPRELTKGGKERMDEFRGKQMRRLSITAISHGAASKPKAKTPWWSFKKRI